MPSQKAARPRKDWYSVSVDTLRGWGLLLLLIVLAGLGYWGYRVWERHAIEREAGRVIAEAEALLGRVPREGEASFGGEYGAAVDSLEQARAEHARADFRAALASARRSRGVLLSILESFSRQGEAVEAEFISRQGEVEYRRGDGGDWEEARGRVQLNPGDYVRTSANGSAEIMFRDGTFYTVRPNTQFVISTVREEGAPGEQAIDMEYGWVDLNTAQRASTVRTPEAEARVQESSEAFVVYDKGARRGRFGAFRGGMELEAGGGLKRQVGELQQVVQTGDLLSSPSPLPGRPEPLDPTDNMEVDLARVRRLGLSWSPVQGAARYALQVSRSHLFVDNIIDVENRARTSATIGVRGEGSFLWRVAAFGRDGARGPWSAPRRFRVAALRGGEEDEVPPSLDLEDVKSYGSIFIVVGRTEPGARVAVNGEQVTVESDGTFDKTVQLTKEGWSFIEIRASDSGGNETVRRHRVFVENP